MNRVQIAQVLTLTVFTLTATVTAFLVDTTLRQRVKPCPPQAERVEPLSNLAATSLASHPET